ncbi:MAG: gephyrin-like molybdotransferase Glp [Bacteroidales bacterium]
MITLQEAYSIVSTDIPCKDSVEIDFRHACGRVLAQDIFSDIDMPPFDKSAVDGYACRRTDLGNILRLNEVIAAGNQPKHTVLPGTCSKIMTGAMIPSGADCVVMVEQSVEEAGFVHFTDTKTKNNIAFKAEDLSSGTKVLSKGTLLKPKHIAVLASVGAVRPMVYQKVKVCVFSTGDELVEPENIPETGQIRNSNGSQLVSQLERIGAEVTYGGIIPDVENETRKRITEALCDHDVLILSGGISMGDFDFVPQILLESGLEIRFQSIAVQPGKPTVFARSGNQFVFALPGNPVSSFNIFEILAKPFLYRLMGHPYEERIVRMPLAEDFARKGTARHGFIPAITLPDGSVKVLTYNGSGHIHALVDANALISIPLGVASVLKGESVDVRFI